MLIDLTLGGALVQYLPAGEQGSRIHLEIEDGASVADALGILGVPPGARMMVIVDGNVVTPDEFVTTTLTPGSKLSVIPPIQAG